MYVSIASRTGGRKYLSIVHGYRDENGKVRKKTIRSLGYLDELELDSFLKNRQRHTEDTFDANAVLQALTYLKIVAPAADSTFFIDRELFFEKNSGTEDEFYQGLKFLYHLKHPLHQTPGL